MSYDSPIHATYRFPAADVSADGVIATLVGPKGKNGRVIGAGSVITTGVAGTQAAISFGSADNNADYGVHTVPVASAGETTNGVTYLSTGKEFIPADSDLVISSDGSPSAGAADVIVHVAWF